MKATCRFNTIFLLSSLKPGELSVAKRLEESALNEAVFRNPGLKLIIRYPSSKDEFLRELDEIASACPTLLPLIHLDLHGNKDYLECASGEHVTRNEIGEKFRAINTACGLNLFVAISACQGGYVALAAHLMSPCPFFALCGPLQDVEAGELLDDYERFYRKLFETKNCDIALDELNNGSDVNYLGVPARYLFNLGWTHYVSTQCGGEALRNRVEELVKKALENGYPKANISKLRKEARQLISDPRQSFEKARDIFFMCDIYPENKLRFPFEYSDLDQKIIARANISFKPKLTRNRVRLTS